jgi:GT2 family glycosyltransferase
VEPHESDAQQAARPRARLLLLAEGPRDARAAAEALGARGAHGACIALLGARAAANPDLPNLGAREVRDSPPRGALPHGGLAAQEDLVQRIDELLGELDPDLVAAPSPLDPERGALGWAALSACAAGRARTLLFPAPGAGAASGPAGGWIELESSAAARVRRSQAELLERLGACGDAPWSDLPRVTAVISTWNKRADVRENLRALRAQSLPFAELVVVDNASRDGTAELVAREFPEVRLIVMPHDRYGACETFNIGFASVTTPLMAILDDDVVLPPAWLELTSRRLAAEPATTAVVSTHVIEPGMPETYRDSAAVNRERYMSTFRGCASLARVAPLAAAGFYDERLFIYGNERDLTCRLLNRGGRVLLYPGTHAFHRTPFGIKLGRRSLYYHARNAWLAMLKYAPLGDLVRMPWLVLTRVVLRRTRAEAQGGVADATGTIGIGRALRETPGAWIVLLKAGLSVLANLPYCLRRREPCRAPDFELPID